MPEEPPSRASLIDRLRPGIERAIEAFNRGDWGDWDVAFGCVAPDFEFHPDPCVRDRTILCDHEVLWSYFQAARYASPDWHLQAEEFIKASDTTVVVRGMLGGTGGGSKPDIRAEVYYVFETKDGRVVRVYEFFERQPAFQQAGLG